MKPGALVTLILFWGFYIQGKESSIHQYYEPVESEKVTSFIQASLQKLQKEFGEPRYKINEIHIRRSKLRENPELITSLDILDWKKFAVNLSNVVSPDELKILKQQTVEKDFRVTAIKHINSLILDKSLIEKSPFKNISLTANEKKWRGDGFFGCFTEDRIRLNRSVIRRLLGNSLSQVKSDTSDLEKAVKMLRQGNARERKEARKKLGSAGEEFKDFFEKLSGDSDPEVSETAKNILKKFAAKKSAAAQTGLTDDVLKMLAIRRLSELNSSNAIPIIEKLKNDKNKDIAHEAERAYAKLKGMSVKRFSRDEGTQKLLKMLPPDAGFIAALDLTEPQKAMQLKDYLAEYKNIPGMDLFGIVLN